MNLNVSHRLLPRLKFQIKGLSWLTLSMGRSETATSRTSSAANDAKGSVEQCKTSLLSVSESQIIPRLLDAHQSPDTALWETLPVAQEVLATEQDMLDFAQACLHTDAQAVFANLDDLRAKGLTQQTIFLDIITPAARHLGDLWHQDKLDFTWVAQGLLRMHHAMRHLGYENQGGPQVAGDARRIMLASAPGSQHILGLAMVSEFFRAEGWQVVVEISTTEKALLHAVSHEWFDVVGLSIGLVEQLPHIPALIASLKQASRNPNTRVILGGPALLDADNHAKVVQADGISVSALEAVKLAGDLLKNR